MKATTILLLITAALATNCATGYHSTAGTGGFEETRLNETTFQVRFAANAYTESNRVSKFLLRRCAEITLEQGHRYFLVLQQDRQSRSSGGWFSHFSFPNGQATIQVLIDDAQHPQEAYDSVTIAKDTEREAGKPLSREARETLWKLGLGPKPEPVHGGIHH